MKRKWRSCFWGCFFMLVCGSNVYSDIVPDADQSKCYNSNGKEIPCRPRGQAFYGPSAAYNTIPSYTKLDENGNPLPDSESSWAMVRDNVTGLVWEEKQNMDGVLNYANPHDADNTYTWYDSHPNTNGGNAGSKKGDRDTESFLNALNVAHFGGYADWRLPTLNELIFLINHNSFTPSIHAYYFPNTKSGHYWSSTTASIVYGAWGVDFSYGFDGSYYKGYYFYVRAVRGGQ